MLPRGPLLDHVLKAELKKELKTELLTDDVLLEDLLVLVPVGKKNI